MSTDPPTMVGERALPEVIPTSEAAIDVWPGGIGRIEVEETTSTLDAVASCVEQPPFWLMARRQTAARGRRGRAWAMPEGNFAATLVLAVNEPPPQRALRSFLMSLALYASLEEITRGRAHLALKWPNDVLLGGGKVAGILLESDGRDRLSIGVGVNLAAAPAATDLEQGAVTAVSVATETGCTIAPAAFLTLLARHYAREEARFLRDGFAPARAAWMDHAAKLGETITARLPQNEITGRFEGIDPEGCLLLETATGLRRIAAAEIYF